MTARASTTAVEFPPISGDALRAKVMQECVGPQPRGVQPFISFKNSQINEAECVALADELNLDFIMGERGCGFYVRESDFQKRLREAREARGV